MKAVPLGNMGGLWKPVCAPLNIAECVTLASNETVFTEHLARGNAQQTVLTLSKLLLGVLETCIQRREKQ